MKMWGTVLLLFIAAVLHPCISTYRFEDRQQSDAIFDVYNETVGDVVDVIFQQRILSQMNQSSCSAGHLAPIVYVTSYPAGIEITNASGYRGIYLLRCKPECDAVMSDVLPANVTSTESQRKLENGLNVVEMSHNKSTYVLSLIIGRATTQETPLLTIESDKFNHSHNLNAFANINGDIMLKATDSDLETRLDRTSVHQIAVLAHSGNGIAILLNGTVISSVADAFLTGLTLTSPPDVFMYQVKQWLIYDTLLTTQDLLTLNNEEVNIEPGMSCNCPQDYPIFKRWPHHNNTLWRGTHCESIDGENTTTRIQAKSFGLQFINDGDYLTFWAGKANQDLDMFTFQLRFNYQIFFSRIDLVTLPQHLVVTKKRSWKHFEEVLYVISNDCSTPLPPMLPQAAPLVCQSNTTLRNGTERRSGVTDLDWTGSLITNITAFNQSVEAGLFDAYYITVYLYGNAGATTSTAHHIISEMKVFGRYYHLLKGLGQLCNCGVGSADGSCNSTGRCICTDDARAGTRPDLADEKCRPFIHTLTPSFGPIAGGTEVVVEGAWLADVQFIYFGTDKVYKQVDKSNDTHMYVVTNSAEEGRVDVYTEGTSTPLVHFNFRKPTNITSIGRTDVFTSGGVDIPVTGTNLDHIDDPMMLVNVMCKSSQQTVQTLATGCRVLGNHEMNCTTPNLGDTVNHTSCSRLVDSPHPYLFTLSFNWSKRVGIGNVIEPTHLDTSLQLNVLPDPQIYKFPENDQIKILSENSDILNIEGSNLKSGAAIEDYEVSIGVSKCIPIFLDDSNLGCQLGRLLPAAGDDYIINPENPGERLPSVVVSVGNIVVHVGYTRLPSQTTSSRAIERTSPVQYTQTKLTTQPSVTTEARTSDSILTISKLTTNPFVTTKAKTSYSSTILSASTKSQRSSDGSLPSSLNRNESSIQLSRSTLRAISAAESRKANSIATGIATTFIIQLANLI